MLCSPLIANPSFLLASFTHGRWLRGGTPPLPTPHRPGRAEMRDPGRESCSSTSQNKPSRDPAEYRRCFARCGTKICGKVAGGDGAGGRGKQFWEGGIGYRTFIYLFIYLFVYLSGGRNVLLWFHHFIYNHQIDFTAEEGALKRTLFNSGKGAHRSAHPSPFTTPGSAAAQTARGCRGAGLPPSRSSWEKEGKKKKYQAKPPQPTLGINTPDRRIERLKV